MTTTKTTNKTALTYAIENLHDAPAEVIEKLENMVAQLDKKNAAPRKITAKQEANEVVKEAIVDFLSLNSDKGFTCSDLLKEVEALEGRSPQYVSALMRSLLLAGVVSKTTDKRKSFFQIAVEA